jgi:flavin-dependent dehydrogenase
MNVDAAVLGGGPAGTAVAIDLARRGYSVVVIERSDYDGARIGETLPPSVQPLLVSLGVWDRFLEEKHSASFGIRSAWGRDKPTENDFIFNPYGVGWHIDRLRFDAMLAQCADEAGATVYRNARLVSLNKIDPEKWKVEIVQGRQRHSFNTTFLVDATGRAACSAVTQRATRIVLDHLIGVVFFFSSTSSESIIDTSTLIEATADGWWYSAALPGFGLVLAYMTDADLYARAVKQSHDYWCRQLAITKHTRLRVEAYSLTSGPRVVSANTSRLNRVTDGTWVAIGDAAMAFDPVSGQGVFRALQSALRVAKSLDRHWNGDASALNQYAETVEQDFYRYLLNRSAFYSKEQRWPASLFWQRRVSDSIVKEH